MIKERKPFPAEDAVEDAVRVWLTQKGCTFQRRKYVDIVAQEPNGGPHWVIEAKGETSQSGLDFRTCLGQILSAIQDDGAVYAVAVPATPAYQRLCGGINDYVRRKLDLHWLLISRSGDVHHVTPDEPLPDEVFVEEAA